MADTNSFNQQIFENFFRDYFKPLVNFANKFLNNIDDSKEIVHDVFINLWEKRDSIDVQNSVKSYLYASVNNRCLNFIRDNKKFNNNIQLDNIDSVVSPSDTLTEIEIQSIIEKTLNTLSPKVKRVFELSRYENLKYKDIAEKLNISQKTVESHISAALKSLKENLKEYLVVFILII
ncbi:MAG: RNA polymerase sigma-70 factor, partial [Bacteroidales bacterium]|nr:RNA polymerase sigma-70 factor [Bacteroidales bacterium]